MRKLHYEVRPGSLDDIDSSITRIRARLLGHRANGDEVLAGICEARINRLLEARAKKAAPA